MIRVRPLHVEAVADLRLLGRADVFHDVSDFPGALPLCACMRTWRCFSCGRRNIVAHPSTVVVVQHQADDAVTDLVHNVVLALT
jgi:hypothetical protein